MRDSGPLGLSVSAHGTPRPVCDSPLFAVCASCRDFSLGRREARTKYQNAHFRTRCFTSVIASKPANGCRRYSRLRAFSVILRSGSKKESKFPGLLKLSSSSDLSSEEQSFQYGSERQSR